MIRLVAMDVDGTLTDGGFWMDGDGNEWKRFDVRDGYGIVTLHRAGIETAFISGRFSKATKQRAAELGVTRLVNGAGDKLSELRKIAEELNIAKEEIAFIGDDEPDLECVCWCGLGIAVSDARGGLPRAADWVTPSPGGSGAVREACEYILERNERERK